jgi:TetR/AcrR family transcriptional regulator
MVRNPTSSPSEAPGARRIGNAARRLFARQGYAGTSMADIANAAGVSKATVFHHFKSKRRLYESLIGEAVAGFREQLVPLLDSNVDLAERLEAFAAVHYRRLAANRGTMRLIIRELLDSTAGSSDLFASGLMAENFSLVVDALRRGQQSGTVRKDADPGLAAFVLLSSGWFLFLTSAIAQNTAGLEVTRSTEQYSRELAGLLALGLKPRSETDTGVPK